MTTDPDRPSPRTRILLGVLLVLVGGAFLVVGLLGPQRCTDEFGAAPGSTATGSLVPTKTTCSPAGLTDPPLGIVGIVFLVLAVPVLQVNELGFAGMTVKRAAREAADGARSASEAADRAATAALTVANAAVAHSSASSTAAGVGAVYVSYDAFGGTARGPISAESGLAFTLAASGVAAEVARTVVHVNSAVVLWLDRPTETLRPHTDPSRQGVAFDSPLGGLVRQARSGTVLLSTPDELAAVGLATSIPVPVTAAVIPALRPTRAAVGLILAVLDVGGVDDAEVQRRAAAAMDGSAAYAVAAAVLIERLTTAGAATLGTGGS